MPYYIQEEIERAREMDLFTYLQRYDPGELVHVHGKEYCTRTHDSLKISNGKWMWWSRGFGGVYAPATPNKDMKVPAAITERLEKVGIKEIIFHLDNGFAGREATRRLAEKLQGEYKIRDEPPLYGKDCNDELRQHARKFERVRRERNRDEAR